MVSIFCHLPSAVRADVHPRLAHGLRRGGVLLLESYTPAQIGRGTGGPPTSDMMLDLATLCATFAGFEVQLGREIERDVHEGQGHRGASAVVQFVATRR